MSTQKVKDAIEVKIREQIKDERTPFEFRAERREATDGAIRVFSNRELAEHASTMLALVHDSQVLDGVETLTDALTNILHWCDREQVDFERCLEMARTHHQAER